MTPEEAFSAYEKVRATLPPSRAGGAATPVETLEDIADRFDVFLLDAFGVLNIGETAIPGVVERISELQAAGKRCLVVTNAAGYPHSKLMDRYIRLGYSFDPEDVISSRKALLHALNSEKPRSWGLAATQHFGTEDLDSVSVEFLAEDPAVYDAAEGFLFLGSAEWTEERQTLLETSLIKNPRPLWIGNPDIVAPREHGMSVEPGHYAHRLTAKTGVKPKFFGKPFANIYDLAFSKLGSVDRSRVVMVGDSLHTDVLGAQTAGVASALITEYGFFAAGGVHHAIDRSMIRPDYLLTRP